MTITSACAATENAIASVVWTPLAIRIAAPAPACVAAPAGAIGSAADAAEAQRKASASGNELVIESAFRSRNTAVPRSAHETETSTQAAHASRVQCVCPPSQRPRRNRVTCRQPVARGSSAITTAASTPAPATTAKPARTVHESASAAATDASGVSAALSSIPSTIRLIPSAPSPARVPGNLRTTAMRIASSTRPGSATPPTQAAPPAAASAPAAGRSCFANSRCQPHALKA